MGSFSRKGTAEAIPFLLVTLVAPLERDAQRELEHAGSIVQVSRRDDGVADVAELAAGDVLLIQPVVGIASR
jgi:hypothetical protein